MRLHGRAFLLMLAVAPGAQPAPGAADLPSQLAAKIADAVRPAAEIVLTVSATEGGEARRLDVREALVRALAERGVRAVDTSGAPIVANVSCGSNLRERACVADIAGASADRQVLAVTRPFEYGKPADETRRPALEIARVFGQRTPILDVALAGDSLFVLEPAAVTLYRRASAGWQRASSRALGSGRPWPRDVRGRIRLNGSGVEAFLPGVTCRGDADLVTLSCAEDVRPWPLGIDNTGIDASRNFFTTPEGLPFYAAATVDASEGSAPRWVIADRFGALAFLDGSRQTVATAGRGDEVAALSSPCGGNFVLVSSRARGAGNDSLQLFRVVERQLVPAAAPREVAGATTAVWAAPGAPVATVITHDFPAERYEAFQARVACDW